VGQGGQYSEDGNYYWDGSEWQLVDRSGATTIPEVTVEGDAANAGNPYAGTAGEQAWLQGNRAARTGEAREAPSVLAEDQMQIWYEGYDTAIPHVEPEHSGVSHAVHGGEVVFAGAGLVYELAHGVAARVALPIFVVEVALAVVIPQGDPPWTAEHRDLCAWFSQACGDQGWPEFFMAVSGGSSSDGDPPYWHGGVYGDYEAAKQEALQTVQQYPDMTVAMLHYQCSSPDDIERIELDPVYQ